MVSMGSLKYKTLSQTKAAFINVLRDSTMYYKSRKHQSLAKIKSSRSGFSGSHRSTKIHMVLKASPFGRLAGYYKRHRGRNNTGSITVYSKGRTFKKSFISYAKELNDFKSTAIALSVSRDPNSNKVAALVSSASGKLCYLPLTSRMCVLKLMFGAGLAVNPLLLGTTLKISRFRCFEQVALLRFYSHICFIAATLSSRVTIAKAEGSNAMTLVRKYKNSTYATTIKLPSGQLKLIQSNVIVLLGVILPTKKKTFKNTRAGY